MYCSITTCIIKFTNTCSTLILEEKRTYFDLKALFHQGKKGGRGGEGSKEKERKEGRREGVKTKGSHQGLEQLVPRPRLTCAHILETAEGLTYSHPWLMEPGCTHKGDALESPVETVSEARLKNLMSECTPEPTHKPNTRE